MKLFTVACLTVALGMTACSTVRQQDLASWKGQPVEKLDMHPLFQAMQVEVRKLSSGVEVRNYVNGERVASCFGNAQATSIMQGSAQVTVSDFCSSKFRACNNMFWIKDGIVQRYTPVGTGGARCYTDERAQPDGWIGQPLNF